MTTLSFDDTSLQIFKSFIVTLPDGSLDCTGVLSHECFNRWLSKRSISAGKPEEAFRRVLTAHVRGSDGRKPFHPDEEKALLLIMRQKKVWECFKGANVNVGVHGFKALGYHEKLQEKLQDNYIKDEADHNDDFDVEDRAKHLSSYEIFITFANKLDANGKSMALSKECYETWVSTRRHGLKSAEHSFRKALIAHLCGKDGRRPFPEKIEKAIMLQLRMKETWPCFAERKEKFALSIGKKGFAHKGYHESLQEGNSNQNTAAEINIDNHSFDDTESKDSENQSKRIKSKMDKILQQENTKIVRERNAEKNINIKHIANNIHSNRLRFHGTNSMSSCGTGVDSVPHLGSRGSAKRKLPTIYFNQVDNEMQRVNKVFHYDSTEEIATCFDLVQKDDQFKDITKLEEESTMLLSVSPSSSSTITSLTTQFNQNQIPFSNRSLGIINQNFDHSEKMIKERQDVEMKRRMIEQQYSEYEFQKLPIYQDILGDQVFCNLALSQRQQQHGNCPIPFDPGFYSFADDVDIDLTLELPEDFCNIDVGLIRLENMEHSPLEMFQDVTAEETVKVLQLKHLCQPYFKDYYENVQVLHPEICFEVAATDVCGDVRLLRILRTCKGDVSVALNEVQSNLKWRTEYDVEYIRHGMIARNLSFEELRQELAFGHSEGAFPFFSQQPNGDLTDIFVIMPQKDEWVGNIPNLLKSHIMLAEYRSIVLDRLSYLKRRVVVTKLIIDAAFVHDDRKSNEHQEAGAKNNSSDQKFMDWWTAIKKWGWYLQQIFDLVSRWYGGCTTRMHIFGKGLVFRTMIRILYKTCFSMDPKDLDVEREAVLLETLGHEKSAWPKTYGGNVLAAEMTKKNLSAFPKMKQ